MWLYVLIRSQLTSVGLLSRIQQRGDAAASDLEALRPSMSLMNVGLDVGVLHYTPTQEPFPLLSDPAGYSPDTSDLSDPDELEYWINVLAGQVPTVIEKAIACYGSTTGTLPPSGISELWLPLCDLPCSFWRSHADCDPNSRATLSPLASLEAPSWGHENLKSSTTAQCCL